MRARGELTLSNKEAEVRARVRARAPSVSRPRDALAGAQQGALARQHRQQGLHSHPSANGFRSAG